MEIQRKEPLYLAMPQAYPFDVSPDDEINLIDLWRILMLQWKVICAITALSILGAVAYVAMATPVYESQAVMRSPESRDVAVLNISDVSQVTSVDIFAKYIVNLKSSSQRQRFADETPELSSVHSLFVNKSPQLMRDNGPKITEGTKFEIGFVFLSLKGPDPKLVTDWVNSFIRFANRSVVDDFCDSIEVKIVNQKKAIEDQLQIARDLEGQRRQDRIAMLDEHLSIASGLGISDRQHSWFATEKIDSSSVTLNAAQEPLYMRGIRELSAEKKQLENRKNDEPFIANFREKQENLARLSAGLKQLQAAKVIATAVTVDQQAIQPENPVQPKRGLVLILSVVFGVTIGVFVAFMVNFVQQQKAKIKEEEEGTLF